MRQVDARHGGGLLWITLSEAAGEPEAEIERQRERHEVYMGQGE